MLNTQPIFQFRSFKSYYDQYSIFYNDHIEVDKILDITNFKKVISNLDTHTLFCPVCNDVKSILPIHASVDTAPDVTASALDQLGYYYMINWNYITCSGCNKNSRQRMVLQQLDQACDNKTNLHIYLMSEIYSGINLSCQEKYPHHHIVSSEFDHPALAADNNIPIENVQKLSFEDNLFDIIVSQDVFEHVADPFEGFRELYRVLTPNGQILLTVPSYFAIPDSHDTLAEELDGETVYYREPEYHDHSLVYNFFGLTLIDDLKAIGFSDVVLEIYQDPSIGLFIQTPLYRITK